MTPTTGQFEALACVSLVKQQTCRRVRITVFCLEESNHWDRTLDPISQGVKYRVVSTC